MLRMRKALRTIAARRARNSGHAFAVTAKVSLARDRWTGRVPAGPGERELTVMTTSAAGATPLLTDAPYLLCNAMASITIRCVQPVPQWQPSGDRRRLLYTRRMQGIHSIGVTRHLAAQAFSRVAGAPLIAGNAVELLVDAEANYPAWLSAIASARSSILLENYIFRADATGRRFLDALVERAQAGVQVHVIRDWLGCIGQSHESFWRPLVDAGGAVRTYSPFRLLRPLAAISRDHRKVLVVDAEVGFVSGLCISDRWLGDPAHGVDPWRDTGVAIRGPALGSLIHAFNDSWRQLGAELPPLVLGLADGIKPKGDVDLRVIATRPNDVGLYRLDQLVAALAQQRLWLADAYFVGTAAYVQALTAAARDGVDVRLLVPGSSDVPAVGSMSRAGYRPLLEAGVRVFEWNGSMMHAKTAVADGRWARVGSTNLNVASWIGNAEIDVAVENVEFAVAMALQYQRDLDNATEIVLAGKTKVRRGGTKPRKRARRLGNGSSGRVAASAMRMANNFGAALTRRRPLGDAESGIVLSVALLLGIVAAIAIWWPRVIAWPLSILCAWLALATALRGWRMRRRTRSDR